VFPPLDFRFEPGPVAWTFTVLSFLSGTAFVLLGGHPLDDAGSVGPPNASLALLGAIVAIGGAVVAVVVRNGAALFDGDVDGRGR
jgi:hypothetical protein